MSSVTHTPPEPNTRYLVQVLDHGYVRLVDFMGSDLSIVRAARVSYDGVLPLNTYTHMFAKVDLHNFLKFVTLRADPHAQWEIQQYAKAMCALVGTVVPVTMKAWANHQEELEA